MEILTPAELRLRFAEIVEKIKKGAIFIHPTDTIYGLGCNAQDEKAVKKLRDLKQRQEAPFSVWVPHPRWIEENCVTKGKAAEWLNKLPGSYTLILPQKNKTAVADNVAPNKKTLGTRYPDHWFGKVVEECNLPIVTTSANQAGQPFMTDLENLDPEIKNGVEFIIYEGPKKGRPSRIVDVKKEKVRER